MFPFSTFSIKVLFGWLLFCHASCVVTPTNNLRFEWPVQPYRISQKYHTFKKRPHLGLDLTAPLKNSQKNPTGTPILSIEKGLVIYAGKQFSGYGNVVMIQHNKHWTSLSAHLDQIKVKEGQKVKKGELIGTMGKTGQSTGVHLHLELFYNKKNVNPLKYLN